MIRSSTVTDKKIIDNIKCLALDMIDSAKSGHPGIVLGAAPILYTLYLRHLKVYPKDNNWVNRDRFVLSAGHGSALLYSMLYFSGHDISIDDLRNFRKAKSITPGHPEYGLTEGVESTTGPLGQGLANAVGMAISEKYYSNLFSTINHYTYVLVSDGDLMEGISYEASSLAGHLKLNKLIVLYDSNNISLDGSTNLSFSENIKDRFESMGWNYDLVSDSEKLEDIDKAIYKAKSSLDKPTIIEIKTIIGKGSINQGTNLVHGSPLKEEDISQLKDSMGIRNVPFAVSKEAIEAFQSDFFERVEIEYRSYLSMYKEFKETSPDKDLYESMFESKKTYNILNMFQDISDMDNISLRDINSKVMNVADKFINNLMGGSADLVTSTKTYLNNYGTFSSNNPTGRNIYFGVREHAMGAIMNGMALSNLVPFSSTFLVFSDYMRPSIRLASLMNLFSIYIFTHDSINIGQDGPTHQPIEHLASLRAIPNLRVYRPADAKEVIGVWNYMLKEKKPTALILSRNEVNTLDGTDALLVSKGAYIVRKENKKKHGIIIATGSELDIAVQVANSLSAKGLDIRVISMPCMSLFEEQPEEYKEELLPIGIKTIVIEFASSQSWYKYVYNKKYLITLDDFGLSGTKEDIYSIKKIDLKSITDRIEKLLQ